jgi:hypothetical protein
MTRHLTEDEFVLLHYGDAGLEERRELENHIAACADCRRDLERVSALLVAVHLPVPEPPEHYERDVWRSLQPMLPATSSRWAGWPGWSKWVAAIAMAAVAILAFGIGRWFERSTEIGKPDRVRQTASEDSISKTARERVLWMAVGAHLDRAQRVLTELENTKASNRIDISAEEEEVQSLLPDNRLYRQTAIQLTDVPVATLLDELERLLVDLSHRPPTLTPGELDDIQNQIEPQGLLFKVRIAGSELRGRKLTRSASAIARSLN